MLSQQGDEQKSENFGEYAERRDRVQWSVAEELLIFVSNNL